MYVQMHFLFLLLFIIIIITNMMFLFSLLRADASLTEHWLYCSPKTSYSAVNFRDDHDAVKNSSSLGIFTFVYAQQNTRRRHVCN
jgi:hypothetical protein